MFEKYSTYVFEDFVQDDKFIKWVKSSERENDLFWSAFLSTYPFKQEVIDQARQVVQNLKEATRKEVAQEDATEIWNAIQSSVCRARKRYSVMEKTMDNLGRSNGYAAVRHSGLADTEP